MSDSGFSSDPTVVDDVSAVREVSIEVDVSTVLSVSTLGRMLMDRSPGIGVAFRESRRGVFARLNVSWMGSGKLGSATSIKVSRRLERTKIEVSDLSVVSGGNRVHTGGDISR